MDARELTKIVEKQENLIRELKKRVDYLELELKHIWNWSLNIRESLLTI